MGQDSNYTVTLAENETLGPYLADDMGFSLYFFADDIPGNATSACFGDCAEKWPPFYRSEIIVPAKLDENDFGAFVRDDGVAQLTYKGWPLYSYVDDVSPGDIKGQGISGLWSVVIPERFPLA
ncbi:MAG: hypothetical protein JW986_01490 [Methanotrichaceae archaeon]|nr:hypothetical protein [Methanotrichaceae archaeon]